MTEIARLRELMAKATPGPWVVSDSATDLVMVLGLDSDGNNLVADEAEIPDADLIASAVNALPALLNRLESAERRAENMITEPAEQRLAALEDAALAVCFAAKPRPGFANLLVDSDTVDRLRAALRGEEE
jgi:hypothetical protein